MFLNKKSMYHTMLELNQTSICMYPRYLKFLKICMHLRVKSTNRIYSFYIMLHTRLWQDEN